MVALEASKLFCQLSPPELTTLPRVASERSYGAGKDIFKEGDEGDGVYRALAGAGAGGLARGQRPAARLQTLRVAVHPENPSQFVNNFHL
jgi:hypothetical protein